jgi:hypothetical protein
LNQETQLLTTWILNDEIEKKINLKIKKIKLNKEQKIKRHEIARGIFKIIEKFYRKKINKNDGT